MRTGKRDKQAVEVSGRKEEQEQAGENRMKNRNRGYTLIEMVVTIAIFVIILGIAVPSLNVIPGFRAQRAVNSIAAAIDKTKVEAMNRLVGEMKLEKRADGYYISYYLDRGKASPGRVREDSPEKIAPAGISITYTTTKDGAESPSKELAEGDALILTFDREDGSFRPLQSAVRTQEEILAYLGSNQDIPFDGEENPYLASITVKGGMRTRVLRLIQETGKYTISPG